jgi:hypothetical protein
VATFLPDTHLPFTPSSQIAAEETGSAQGRATRLPANRTLLRVIPQSQAK